MKKIILKLATLMSVLAFVMASCNNEPAFGEHNENQKEKLELLQSFRVQNSKLSSFASYFSWNRGKTMLFL